MSYDPFDENPERKQRSYEWTKGDSEAQKAAMLAAKATLRFIREHPGCTLLDIIAAGIKPNFEPLMQHRLAYWSKNGVVGDSRKEFRNEAAQWYARNINPRP